MSEFKKITLTHANLDQKVRLVVGSICGYHYSEGTKSTHVYCYGQTVFPVKETLKEIDALIDSATNNNQSRKEIKND